jgi:hypothetical protein
VKFNITIGAGWDTKNGIGIVWALDPVGFIFLRTMGEYLGVDQLTADGKKP